MVIVVVILDFARKVEWKLKWHYLKQYCVTWFEHVDARWL